MAETPIVQPLGASMEDPYLYRRWDHPEASTLEQLHGWLEDIDAARDFLTRLSGELAKDEPDHLVVDALASAAVVRYARCFASGNRGTLDPAEVAVSGESESLALHEHVMAVRNLHVAHAINKQEAHTLMVILHRAADAPQAIAGFSSRSARGLALEPPDVPAVIALCDRWREHLTQRIVKENLRVLPFCQQLSRDQLLALPADEVQPSQNVNARRRQPGNRPRRS